MSDKLPGEDNDQTRRKRAQFKEHMARVLADKEPPAKRMSLKERLGFDSRPHDGVERRNMIIFSIVMVIALAAYVVLDYLPRQEEHQDLIDNLMQTCFVRDQSCEAQAKEMVRLFEQAGVIDHANVCFDTYDASDFNEQVQLSLCLASLFDRKERFVPYADLSGEILPSANLQGEDMHGANLQDAHLLSTNLQDANLAGANLRGANLHYVNFAGADLSSANLSGADLTNAMFDETTLLPDNSNWTADTDMARFADPTHPDFWDPCVELDEPPSYCEEDE